MKLHLGSRGDLEQVVYTALHGEVEKDYLSHIAWKINLDPCLKKVTYTICSLDHSLMVIKIMWVISRLPGYASLNAPTGLRCGQLDQLSSHLYSNWCPVSSSNETGEAVSPRILRANIGYFTLDIQ